MTDLPASICPFCDYLLDDATCLGNRKTPRPGDYSVCLRCSSLLKFGADMHVVPVPHSELKRMPDEMREQLDRLQLIVRNSDRSSLG